MTSDSKKAADLHDREQRLVMPDDDVVERTDFFIFVVGHILANQLARAIPMADDRDVNRDETYALREHRCRIEKDEQHQQRRRRRGNCRKLRDEQGKLGQETLVVRAAMRRCCGVPAGCSMGSHGSLFWWSGWW